MRRGAAKPGIVVGAAAAVLPQLDQLLPAVQTVLPNHYYELLSAVLVVGNSVLRTITSVGVSLSDARTVRR